MISHLIVRQIKRKFLEKNQKFYWKFSQNFASVTYAISQRETKKKSGYPNAIFLLFFWNQTEDEFCFYFWKVFSLTLCPLLRQEFLAVPHDSQTDIVKRGDKVIVLGYSAEL